MNLKTPFLMLSYGEFRDTHKLFSFDKRGTEVLPIFTDFNLATAWAKDATNAIVELAEKPPLRLQVCNNRQMAVDMFRTLAMVYATKRSIPMVAIDPLMISESSEERLLGQYHSFADVLDALSERSKQV